MARELYILKLKHQIITEKNNVYYTKCIFCIFVHPDPHSRLLNPHVGSWTVYIVFYTIIILCINIYIAAWG